ncbi:MAG: pyridine nucleotide-disulfide oxidoreductase [Phycisphaeraceae bacterium]|nr:MAG: pyridine nucleotide-disulfide oxidoreductase [Phycisphaeraceae bacterium]
MRDPAHEDKVHEVVVVGAGPIGIELAVALQRAGIDYAHLDAGAIGSTLEWWAPGTKFFSSPERIAIAGVPLASLEQEKATREEYLAYLRQVVQTFGLRITQYERVTDIKREGETFVLRSVRSRSRHASEVPPEVTGDSGAPERVWRARRIVLAIGDMHRPHLVGIPGEDLPHVSHYFEEPHRYFGQRVVIIGGKNSAVEAAIRLHRVGAEVTISYRQPEFSERVKYWLRPELLYLIKQKQIGFVPRTVPVRITEEGVAVRPVEGGGDERMLPADFVLLLTGYEQDTTLFERAGVELIGPGRAPKHHPRTMETNVPGVFVAGTASAGTQIGGVKVFIETSHVHVRRIMSAITGEQVDDAALETPEFALPES